MRDSAPLVVQAAILVTLIWIGSRIGTEVDPPVRDESSAADAAALESLCDRLDRVASALEARVTATPIPSLDSTKPSPVAGGPDLTGLRSEIASLRTAVHNPTGRALGRELRESRPSDEAALARFLESWHSENGYDDKGASHALMFTPAHELVRRFGRPDHIWVQQHGVQGWSYEWGEGDAARSMHLRVHHGMLIGAQF